MRALALGQPDWKEWDVETGINLSQTDSCRMSLNPTPPTHWKVHRTDSIAETVGWGHMWTEWIAQTSLCKNDFHEKFLRVKPSPKIGPLTWSFNTLDYYMNNLSQRRDTDLSSQSESLTAQVWFGRPKQEGPFPDVHQNHPDQARTTVCTSTLADQTTQINQRSSQFADAPCWKCSFQPLAISASKALKHPSTTGILTWSLSR